MAELGSINTTDTNRGVTPVTKESDLAALNAGLNLTGKVITEAAKTDIRNDLKEDADDAIAASDAALSTPVEYEPLTEEGLASSGLDLTGVDKGAVVNFTNEMRRHQAIATQAKDNASRTRATQMMQRTLQQAKQKYPWLRNELQAEASAFISSSADLTELGLRDAGVNASNAGGGNTDYLDEIKKRAYGTGALDLKMDPQIQMGTPEFAVQYERRMKKKQAEILLNEDTALFAAEKAPSARKAADITRRHLTAPEGLLMQVYDSIDGLVQPLHNLRNNFSQGTVTRGELAAEQDNWNRNTKPRIDKLLERTIVEMQADFAKIWAGNLASTPEAEANRTLLNDSINNVKMMRATLDGDVQDVKMMLSTISHVSTAQALDKAPAMRDLVDFIEATPVNLPDTLEKWQVTNANAWDMNLTADGLFSDMQDMYPNLFVRGQEVKGLPPEEARAKRRANRTQGNPHRRLQGGTPEQQAIDSFGSIANIRSEAATGKLASPERAKYGLVTYAASLEDLSTRFEPLAPEEKQELRDGLADPAILGLVEEAGRDSSEVQQMRLAYEQDFFGIGGKDSLKAWNEEIKALAGTRIAQGTAEFAPGFSLINLVDFDESQIRDSGVVTFSVDTDAVRNAVSTANPTLKENDGNLFALQEKAINDAEKAAKKLSEQATKYTQATGNLVYLKDQRQKEPQYLRAFFETGAAAQGMNDIFQIFDVVR